MSDNVIDFETGGPIFQVEIYHRNPGTVGYWTRAFNAADEKSAMDKAVNMFEMEGLNPVIIDNIVIAELHKLEGDSDGRR